MAIRKIFKEGEDILKKVCRPVTKFDANLGVLLDDMFETMAAADGVGLAGPQVGICRRLAVVDTGDDRLELVNPVIIESDGTQIGPEGCLSVDSSKNCNVLRPYKVTVKAQDRTGKEFTGTYVGLTARCICHELDHLDGILFYTKEYKDAQ
ncbi:MAG: peptide deformylase [Clostridia bacterium]|nr:peptide deformylase [Clostridia bacterium]